MEKILSEYNLFHVPIPKIVQSREIYDEFTLKYRGKIFQFQPEKKIVLKLNNLIKFSYLNSDLVLNYTPNNNFSFTYCFPSYKFATYFLFNNESSLIGCKNGQITMLRKILINPLDNERFLFQIISSKDNSLQFDGIYGNKTRSICVSGLPDLNKSSFSYVRSFLIQSRSRNNPLKVNLYFSFWLKDRIFPPKCNFSLDYHLSKPIKIDNGLVFEISPQQGPLFLGFFTFGFKGLSLGCLFNSSKMSFVLSQSIKFRGYTLHLQQYLSPPPKKTYHQIKISAPIDEEMKIGIHLSTLDKIRIKLKYDPAQ